MIFPVTKYNGRSPVVTQEFRNAAGGQRAHLGIDIMFPYDAADPDEAVWRAARFDGKPRFSFPRTASGAFVVASFPGEVVYAKPAENGLRVRLAHEGWDSIGLHMRQLFVRSGQLVRAGEVLGLPGVDPTDENALPHLHWEARIPSVIGARDFRGMIAQRPEVMADRWKQAITEMQVIVP